MSEDGLMAIVVQCPECGRVYEPEPGLIRYGVLWMACPACQVAPDPDDAGPADPARDEAPE